MHTGCSGSFENGKQVVNKLRSMGYSAMQIPVPLAIICEGCNKNFSMETFEAECPECGMVYGVTPCHSDKVENVQAAGIAY